jgi:hypothetical protein
MESREDLPAPPITAPDLASFEEESEEGSEYGDDDDLPIDDLPMDEFENIEIGQDVEEEEEDVFGFGDMDDEE